MLSLARNLQKKQRSHIRKILLLEFDEIHSFSEKNPPLWNPPSALGYPQRASSNGNARLSPGHPLPFTSGFSLYNLKIFWLCVLPPIPFLNHFTSPLDLPLCVPSASEWPASLGQHSYSRDPKTHLLGWLIRKASFRFTFPIP